MEKVANTGHRLNAQPVGLPFESPEASVDMHGRRDSRCLPPAVNAAVAFDDEVEQIVDEEDPFERTRLVACLARILSSGHQDRKTRLVQDRPCDPTKDPLAQFGLTVGAHDKEIGAKGCCL